MLGGLLLVYLAYTRLGGAERVELAVRDRYGDAMPADNGVRYDGNAPKIGGASVGTVRQTQFFHKNEQGVVDREFGFEELVHQQGEQWEITKPYMRLFMQQFRCRVTADRGQVQCEMASGRLVPDDATFSGNVVIHVIANDPNDPELFIYLDDVAFVAERSLFSTSGPIKFVSRVAQLVGRGMELIYDEGRNRLELFRIEQLESLRARSADLGPLLDTTERGGLPAAGAADANTVVVTAAGVPTEGTSDLYECVFWKNVRIEGPEQIIVARQWLAINNILWSNDNAAAPNEPALEVVSPVAAGLSGPNEPDVVPYPGPNALDTSPSDFIALSTLPESSFDIVITCDGGFVIGPKGVGTDALEPNDSGDTAERDSYALTDTLSTDPNHQTLFAEWIDVNGATSDVMLAGPVQIGFALDANDLAGRDPSGELMPVTITAQDRVRYLAAIDRILFEGDCVAKMQQTIAIPDAAFVRDEYMLRAPTLALDLIEDPNAPRNQLRPRYVAAFGGPISLHGLRRRGEDTISWVKLDGSRLDCNLSDEEFLLAGPGTISLHNAEPDPDADPNELSLSQPCYALMSDFKRLTYSASTQRIVATSDERIQLGYVPILEDGRYGPAVNADAGHIELLLTRTDDDQVELKTLTASRGITYEDDTQTFAGSTFTYDHTTGLLRVTGDAAQPCYFNGALVDQIEMNVSTGHVKMEIQDPGTLQIK